MSGIITTLKKLLGWGSESSRSLPTGHQANGSHVTQLSVSVIVHAAQKEGYLASSFNLSLIKSDGNNWGIGGEGEQVFNEKPEIAVGATRFDIELVDNNLSTLYVFGSGGIKNSQGQESIFVMEPPKEHVSDRKAFDFGPPWIPLDGLSASSALAGDLYIINGDDPQEGGAHPKLIGAWALNVKDA
ncbi:hypothetical protein [Teredinibacter purpureus]|uniref:hypothetical protein n=1 Tax=Teredinibacter purpureus TaxID=2731756 RepID=UPI0005F7FBFA|nr:hypothetical protein [Teredinibacter purpureus]